MNSLELHAAIRDLVTQAQNPPRKLRLSQICRDHSVSYDRLWRFMQKDSNILMLDEAQRLFEGLSGKPLLPAQDVL